MSIEIEVSDTQAHMKVDPADVLRIVRHVLVAENRPDASISIALVDNDTIQRLNVKHLKHDWPTDVISFGLSEPGEDELSGELVVSAETAVSAAARAGVAVSQCPRGHGLWLAPGDLDEVSRRAGPARRLPNLLPICCGCKRLRNLQGGWETLELFFSRRSGVQFSHGFCPACTRKQYGELLHNEAC